MRFVAFAVMAVLLSGAARAGEMETPVDYGDGPPLPSDFTRSVEGVCLPWHHSGIWPYSPSVGEPPAPELLLQAAVAHEAEECYYLAYYTYRRVLVEYPAYIGRDILKTVYLGMARSLLGMERNVRAAKSLLKWTERRGALHGSTQALKYLERLTAVLSDDDDTLLRDIEARIASWPKSRVGKPPSMETRSPKPARWKGVSPTRSRALSTKGRAAPEDSFQGAQREEGGRLARDLSRSEGVRDKDVHPPDYGKTPAELYGRVCYYKKRGDMEAARIYTDFLAGKFPKSRYVRKALTLIGGTE